MTERTSPQLVLIDMSIHDAYMMPFKCNAYFFLETLLGMKEINRVLTVYGPFFQRRIHACGERPFRF